MLKNSKFSGHFKYARAYMRRGRYAPDLKRELGRLWKLKIVEVVPVVLGALGSVTKGFDRWIKKLGIPFNVGVMQKAALLGTARILRKVLEM